MWHQGLDFTYTHVFTYLHILIHMISYILTHPLHRKKNKDIKDQQSSHIQEEKREEVMVTVGERQVGSILECSTY